ncbi:MAG: hypothetical protein ACKVOU_15045 [Cytophagales bacterium]
MSKLTAEKIDHFRDEKISNERFSISYIVKDAVYNIAHVERKRFFYTAYDLFVNPGKSINRVLDGFRNYLFNAGEYLFVSGAIVLFLTPRYKFFENEFSEQISDITFITLDPTFLKSFFEYAEEYATITNILAIPIFSFLTYLFFRDSKFTFGENLIINTYITAQQLILLVLCAPFIEFLPSQRHTIITIYSEIVFIYNIGVCVLVFRGVWWWVLVRAVASVSIGYAAQFPINLSFYYLFEPFLKYLPDF